MVDKRMEALVKQYCSNKEEYTVIAMPPLNGANHLINQI